LPQEREQPHQRGLISTPSDEVRAQSRYYTREGIAILQGVKLTKFGRAMLNSFREVSEKLQEQMNALDPQEQKTFTLAEAKLTQHQKRVFTTLGRYFTQLILNDGAQAANGRIFMDPALKTFEHFSLNQNSNLQNMMGAMGRGAPYGFVPSNNIQG
jgi:hypothetical protein